MADSSIDRKTWKLRNKLLLPTLPDHNDLPTDNISAFEAADIEAGRSFQHPGDGPVLPEKEQESLVHHQIKLSKSHTFYKPHETETHHAFPLRLLIAIVLLLDLHSCLQISLGICTWGIDDAVRPRALTTVILCCSIAANSTAGILITIGDRRTRKKDVLERMFKQDLTKQAMDRVQKRNEKANESGRDSEDGDGLREVLVKKGLNVLGRRSEDQDQPRGSQGSRKPADEAGRFNPTTSAAAAAGRNSSEAL